MEAADIVVEKPFEAVEDVVEKQTEPAESVVDKPFEVIEDVVEATEEVVQRPLKSVEEYFKVTDDMSGSVEGSGSQTKREKPSKMVENKMMVSPSARDAPRFSSKKPYELRRFLRSMEDAWKDSGVDDDDIKKTSLGKYADEASEEEWMALETYGRSYSWDEFKEELLENYPEAAAAERGTPYRIKQLCRETKEIRLGDLPALYAFRRAFMSEAKKLLKPPAAMANRELVELFIGCLSEHLGSALLQFLGNNVLISKESAGDRTKESPKGKKGIRTFEGLRISEETRPTEDEPAQETSVARRPEDRYDLEDVCKAAVIVSESSQGMFNLMKKEAAERVEGRGVFLFNQPVSETKELSQKVEELEGVQALEKDRVVSLNKTMESKMSEIETMIKSLVAQGQNAAKSGTCKGDCKGSGCKVHEASGSSMQKWGKSLENEKCFYCGRMGHFQADCDDMKEQIRAGNLKVNPEGRLRLRDGSLIPGYPQGSCMKERVEKYYSRRPAQFYFGEYVEEESVGSSVSKFPSQYVNSNGDAERRAARTLEAELELRKREEALELRMREEALELRRKKLELEEKKLEPSSGISRSTNLLDMLGQLSDEELAALKAARAGFN